MIKDINFVCEEIQGLPPGDNCKFVISDLRYGSEVQQLKEAFGENLITVRVNRFDTNPSSDASENDLNDHKFDIVIENRGTLEELNEKVDSLLRFIHGIYE